MVQSSHLIDNLNLRINITQISAHMRCKHEIFNVMAVHINYLPFHIKIMLMPYQDPTYFGAMRGSCTGCWTSNYLPINLFIMIHRALHYIDNLARRRNHLPRNTHSHRIRNKLPTAAYHFKKIALYDVVYKKNYEYTMQSFAWSPDILEYNIIKYGFRDIIINPTSCSYFPTSMTLQSLIADI